jgi:hypothetical protein
LGPGLHDGKPTLAALCDAARSQARSCATVALDDRAAPTIGRGAALLATSGAVYLGTNVASPPLPSAPAAPSSISGTPAVVPAEQVA